jgi:hypothetical protein
VVNPSGGAILESFIENTDNLTNEKIKAFLEKTVATDYGRRTAATYRGART